MEFANANQDLNFIPDEVLQARQRAKRRSVNNKLSILILVIAIGASAGLFAYNQYLIKKNDDIKDQIAEKEKTIKRLKEFGKTGYNLGVRLDAIKKILTTRHNYSNLVSEITSRTPPNVIVSRYSATESGKLSLDGTAFPNYTPIADFQKRLLSDVGESSLFKEVQIGSATLDSSSSTVSFSLNIQLNMKELTENVE